MIEDWGVKEIAEAVFNLDHDAANFGEILDEAKNDPEFLKKLVALLEENYEQICCREEVCMKCRVKYEVKWQREYIGDYGSEKCYQDIGYFYCPECREEA